MIAQQVGHRATLSRGQRRQPLSASISQHGDLVQAVQQEWPKLPLLLLQNFRSFYQKHYRVGYPAVSDKRAGGLWTPPPTMMSQILSCHHNTKRLFIRAAAEIPTKRTKKRYPAAAQPAAVMGCKSSAGNSARTAPPSQAMAAMQQLCCRWQMPASAELLVHSTTGLKFVLSPVIEPVTSSSLALSHP
jgi:hypothetical protein